MHNIALSLMAMVIAGLTIITSMEDRATNAAEVVPNMPLEQLARLAVSEDVATANDAIIQLRAAGQAGLDALFDAHPEIAQRAVIHARCEQPETERWRCAVDAVARQRDAAFSQLYWHTDLEHAKAVAAEQNKLILSLRLLGELHEEYSCANSRYFRTVLYADPLVADDLRDRFVLHWQSVRPVPRITIDMGDGRRIERTITGNSVHYVLDSDGQVLDVIPGLWDAESFRVALSLAPFRRELTQTAPATFVWSGNADDQDKPNELVAELAGGLALSKFGPERPMLAAMRGDGNSTAREFPAGGAAILESETKPAREAGELARSKRAAEFRMLQRSDEFHNPRPAASGAGKARSIAASRLSSSSQRLMWQKRFGAEADPSNAEQQRVMQSLIAAFQQTLAADTALNRDELHPRALRWLAQSPESLDVELLNERVYAELFLTPLDDPWMGLVPSDAYAALADEGLIVPR